MELVSEDFEHWWLKGDKIMWSCITEGERERRIERERGGGSEGRERERYIMSIIILVSMLVLL